VLLTSGLLALVSGLLLFALYRCCKGGNTLAKTIPSFCFAGAIFGFAVGAVNTYTLRTTLADHCGQWSKPMSFSLLGCTLAMALVWGVTAYFTRKDILIRMTEFCSLVVLVTGLSVGFNLVPGLWPQANKVIDLGTLVAFVVCSFPLGLITLVLGLALLECLFAVLETSSRSWRGHFFCRWTTLLPAYHWGFFIFC